MNKLLMFTTQQLRNEILRRDGQSKTEWSIKWLKDNDVAIGEKIYAKNSIGAIFIGILTKVDNEDFYLDKCFSINTDWTKPIIKGTPPYDDNIHCGASSLKCLYLHTTIDFNNTETYQSKKKFYHTNSEILKHGLNKKELLKGTSLYIYELGFYMILRSNKDKDKILKQAIHYNL